MPLLNVPTPTRNQVGVAHIAIKVGSPDGRKEAYGHLQAQGVRVNRSVEHTQKGSRYFTDPDGSELVIYYEFPTSKVLVRSGRGYRDFILTFENPVPPWASPVADDCDPETTADRYNRGTVGQIGG